MTALTLWSNRQKLWLQPSARRNRALTQLRRDARGEHEDEATYLKWVKVVTEAARLLIPYQSPRFRPIAVRDVEDLRRTVGDLDAGRSR